MTTMTIETIDQVRAQPAHTTIPDVAAYLAVHRAMRASNQLLVDGFTRAPRFDPARTDALRRWFAGYAAELRTHHRIEDELIFPALAERAPGYASIGAQLDADHHRLDELMDALTLTLETWAACRDEESVGSLPADALFYAVEMRDLLAEHLDIEDAQVIPMICEHFTAEEYEVFDKAAAKAIDLKHAFWTVPWIMAMFDAPTLERLWNEAPLMLKLIYRLGRRGYARLTAAAFGDGAEIRWN